MPAQILCGDPQKIINSITLKKAPEGASSIIHVGAAILGIGFYLRILICTCVLYINHRK